MQPIINSFSPTAGAPGQKITINGSGFTGTTSVKFGGYEALAFNIKSNTLIEAFVPTTGSGVVSVTNPDGTASKSGFTPIATRVRITDLPPLGRDADPDTDLIYVWDGIRQMLTNAPVSALPAGDGVPGGGDGSTGNIYTVLGSPFKVRSYDTDQYSYDPTTNTVTVTDVRLIGKEGYVVYASDLNSELEDYNSSDGSGYLEYDSKNGLLHIHNYQLIPGYHITIYADGVVTTDLQNYLISLKSKILTFDKVLAPVLANKGTVWPWRRPAIDIPAGWQECTDFRGKTLIGLNPVDEDFKSIDSTGGAKDLTMKLENLVEHDHEYRVVAFGGNYAEQLESNQLKRDDDIGLYLGRTLRTNKTGSANPSPMKVLNPYRIVFWIEYIG